MHIQVLGPGCAKCKKLETMTRDALSAEGVEATVEKVTDIMEISKLGVFATPALIIDGQIVATGSLPSKGAIAKWILQKKGQSLA